MGFEQLQNLKKAWDKDVRRYTTQFAVTYFPLVFFRHVCVANFYPASRWLVPSKSFFIGVSRMMTVIISNCFLHLTRQPSATTDGLHLDKIFFKKL